MVPSHRHDKRDQRREETWGVTNDKQSKLWWLNIWLSSAPRAVYTGEGHHWLTDLVHGSNPDMSQQPTAYSVYKYGMQTWHWSHQLLVVGTEPVSETWVSIWLHADVADCLRRLHRKYFSQFSICKHLSILSLMPASHKQREWFHLLISKFLNSAMLLQVFWSLFSHQCASLYPTYILCFCATPKKSFHVYLKINRAFLYQNTYLAALHTFNINYIMLWLTLWSMCYI